MRRTPLAPATSFLLLVLLALPYLYVGNYVDSDVSILNVNGATITDTGKKLELPGQPASMRGRAR